MTAPPLPLEQEQPIPVQKTAVLNNNKKSTELAFTKLALEMGENVTRLIRLQEQQMLYINILFNIVANEQQQQQQIKEASKPIDNGSRTEKDQTIQGKTK